MTRAAFIVLQVSLAIGVPALIAALAPRRWRLRAIALWAVAPLLVVVALAATEIATGKASATDLDKLFYGLLLISSFVAAPWLMACGVGYAIGAMLRRRRHPEAAAVELVEQQTAPADPVAYSRPPVDPDPPTLSPPSGWRAAHVGFDHDDLVLDGLPVWKLPWREETEGKVPLPHPAHPHQQHSFTIYSIDDGARATRFAAAELSNSVWGFYRYLPAMDDAASATSAPPTRLNAGPRRTARNCLVALLILVGALALIAAATMITLHVRSEPPAQKLDTIPPMPQER